MREKIIDGLWNVLGLPCREAIRLASLSMDRPLSWSEKIRLRLHFYFCDHCHHYTDQLQMIRKTARQTNPPPVTPLSEEARRKIRQALESSISS